MMNINPFAPDAETMVQAAQALAARSGVDAEIMEGLIRKVARAAQHDLFLRMMPRAHNDTGDPDA